MSLEGEAQPQSNSPAIVNALILEATIELSEVGVGIYACDWQDLPGSGVDIQEERADVGEFKRGVRIRRRTQRVIEDVVEISTNFES